jgi:diguanylate cyclase (GGDEF)-like protein
LYLKIKKGKFLKEQRRKTLYTIIFVIFAVFNTFLGYYIYYEKINSFTFQKINEISNQYKTVTGELSKKSNIYFDEVVNKKNILELYSQIGHSTEKDNEIREELVEQLSKSFKRMREKNIRQFHFHTKDNRSFLRMHKQEKFGDSLKNIRYSVNYVNRTLRPIYGFEEGRINNGFRNVYPIIYDGMHLGSVEISFSFQEVSETLQNLFDGYYTFIISKQLVEKKVFSSKDNYIESSISEDFYAEVGHINKKIINDRNNFKIFEEINEKLKSEISPLLTERKSFSKIIEHNSKTYIISFFPIKNIEGHEVAYVVNYTEADILNEEFNNFIIQAGGGGFIIFLFIYMMLSNVRKEEFEFINKILDNQNSLILVKNKDEVVRVNKKFLDFFGYESLQEMKEVNECICDYFIQEEGYLSRNFSDNNFVINYIIENNHNQHKVKIVEHSTKMVRIFNINVTELKEQNLFLLILSDITTSELEKEMIKDKANRDKLTNVYNRTKFDIDVKNAVLKNRTFSLILCDIDRFKVVNDSYGHLTGDKILIEFATLLDLKIRKSDIIYRWGGEEFIIIVDDRMISATKLAEKLRAMLEKHRFFKEIPITASFGVTEHRKFESVDELLLRVDKALYTAKISGRNTVITS